jgi:ferredoxin
LAISKVTIEDGCTACSLCEQICPDVFEMDADTAKVKEGVDFSKFEAQIKEAAEGCPVTVIKVE